MVHQPCPSSSDHDKVCVLSAVKLPIHTRKSILDRISVESEDQLPRGEKPGNVQCCVNVGRRRAERRKRSSPSVEFPTTCQYPSPSSVAGLGRILPGPFTGRRLVPGAVRLVDMCNLGNQRVIGVGVRQHRADGEQNCGTVSNMHRLRHSIARMGPFITYPLKPSTPDSTGLAECRGRCCR